MFSQLPTWLSTVTDCLLVMPVGLVAVGSHQMNGQTSKINMLELLGCNRQFKAWAGSSNCSVRMSHLALPKSLASSLCVSRGCDMLCYLLPHLMGGSCCADPPTNQLRWAVRSDFDTSGRIQLRLQSEQAWLILPQEAWKQLPHSWWQKHRT